MAAAPLPGQIQRLIVLCTYMGSDGRGQHCRFGTLCASGSVGRKRIECCASGQLGISSIVGMMVPEISGSRILVRIHQADDGSIGGC